jgi:hypothetical protein
VTTALKGSCYTAGIQHQGHRYPCQHPGCSRVFTTRQNAAEHYRRQRQGYRPPPRPCKHPGCGKVASSRITANRHYRDVHQGQKYPCKHPECGRVFSSNSSVFEHYRDVHQHQREPIPCKHPGCDKVSLTLRGADQHSRQHQRRELDLQVQCKHPGCGKSIIDNGIKAIIHVSTLNAQASLLRRLTWRNTIE